ncbi:DnaJ like protein subfamily C member 4 [Trachymyrmex septentrionalis]|uniref:DnaJ like protein subfamily C member 4 n=1 Tax=Trachymyrmex septentrionalis TaxID=34720 RepID=A0A195FFH7_9HYME|nr:PREDICTED: dnaJ homolog subfamily C member 4-like [Trachymyrmex septentrionalis]KYN39138.1 DnaJ like protein subfamily C member 4 [Trachymyrmex septentrionalis]
MAQFTRVCKSEICCMARSYGTWRYQQNHYEILNVSPHASQKEIRQAFIKLSKQLHPDITGKQDHTDFVRLNEAYMILSKENTKRQYDFDLKYNKYNPSYVNNSQNTQYSSQWEYEVRTAGGPWPPPPPRPPNEYFGLLVALVCAGLGFLQLFFMLYSMKVRKIVALRHTLIENKYKQIRESARIKNEKFSIKDFNSEEDLKEYLSTAEDSSEC